jgi:hypothetical protein
MCRNVGWLVNTELETTWTELTSLTGDAVSEFAVRDGGKLQRPHSQQPVPGPILDLGLL